MELKPNYPQLTLTGIMISDSEKSGITAYFAEFPEVIAQGKNTADAKSNLLEAFRFMLEFKQSEIDYDEDDDFNITKESFSLSIS